MGPTLYDDLDGQVVLVTGANRGIGEQIAADLTELGATVYAGARDPGSVTVPNQRPVKLDVTDERSIEAAIERIDEDSGHLDVLMNNAGVYGPSGQFGESSTDDITTTLRVNLHGPLLCCRYALRLLTEREGARIINVSSGAGQFSGGIDSSHLPYGVSKAGLNAMTNALAAQYPTLLVNAACPGWVRTDMGGSGAPRNVKQGAETPVWLARFREGPSGRLWRDKTIQEW
jgi:NAD(P)-dependent dehydrogenase (short-subunit alcohol dehydrogenase family)